MSTNRQNLPRRTSHQSTGKDLPQTQRVFHSQKPSLRDPTVPSPVQDPSLPVKNLSTYYLVPGGCSGVVKPPARHRGLHPPPHPTRTARPGHVPSHLLAVPTPRTRWFDSDSQHPDVPVPYKAQDLVPRGCPGSNDTFGRVGEGHGSSSRVWLKGHRRVAVDDIDETPGVTGDGEQG